METKIGVFKKIAMDTLDCILQDLVQDSGLSLREIEKQSNVASSQMSSYLKGSIPTIPVACRIAKFFDVSVDYLFGLDEQKKRGTYADLNLSVFLERYQKVLKENKINHWKFCQENGLSESCRRKWRKGTMPSTAYLVVIAKQLSCSIDWLIGRK